MDESNHHAFQFVNDNQYMIELSLQKSQYPEIVNKLLTAEKIMTTESPKLSRHDSKAYKIFKYYEPHHIHAQFRVCDYEFTELNRQGNIDPIKIQRIIQRLQKPVSQGYHHAKYLLSGIYFLNPCMREESDRLLKEAASWELVVEEEEKVYINAEAKIEYAFNCLMKDENNYELAKGLLYEAYCTDDQFLSDRVKKFMRDCSNCFNRPVPNWAKN
ncbi:6354_t:CDS:2 [Acaulospora morrowiae]|uniref:6354_t:CDS:1 n=1 Tax=Acaulospora morrowiae TaxID=94023 RepID=A0A9N8Z2N4_9GLOM|nr:6354_t:CDS:2 [Acaulospora morrowiae]